MTRLEAIAAGSSVVIDYRPEGHPSEKGMLASACDKVRAGMAYISKSDSGLSRFQLGALLPIAAACTVGLSSASLVGALSRADISRDNTLDDNISAFREAYKAPADHSVIDQTASTADLIARDYFEGPHPMVQSNLAPKDIHIKVKYVGKNQLNAEAARLDHNSPSTPRHSFNIVVKTNSAGEWVFEKDAFGTFIANSSSIRVEPMGSGFPANGRAKAITPMMVVGHELGHTIYPSAYEAYGAASIDRVMNRAGIKLNEKQHAGALTLLHGNPWSDSVVNESFADSMGLIYLAKKLNKTDFINVIDGLRAQRQTAEQTLFKGLDIDLAQAAKTRKPAIADHFNPDTHITYDAVQAVDDIGYDKLRALSPEQIPQTALDCAHEGFFRMAGRHPDAFAMLVAPSGPQSSEMSANFIAAGLSLISSGNFSYFNQIGLGQLPPPAINPLKIFQWKANRSPSTAQPPGPTTRPLAHKI